MFAAAAIADLKPHAVEFLPVGRNQVAQEATGQRGQDADADDALLDPTGGARMMDGLASEDVV
ncbi:hypothetical protein [Paracoccus pantotrophus]|uniref:hypothetical protein n=1 Tax=Paracoccus pantotrophus TaxID=82367 RepID=UPI00211D5252|nr:hypothetical protein [Paracoccus pantotrophus]